MFYLTRKHNGQGIKIHKALEDANWEYEIFVPKEWLCKIYVDSLYGEGDWPVDLEREIDEPRELDIYCQNRNLDVMDEEGFILVYLHDNNEHWEEYGAPNAFITEIKP